MTAIQPSMRRKCATAGLASWSPWSIRWDSWPSVSGRRVGGSLPKNFDTQRERRLQPLVDGIGASEQDTCCS